jgi:hypothetical protein
LEAKGAHLTGHINQIKEQEQRKKQIAQNTVYKGLAVAHYWGLILERGKKTSEAAALAAFAFYSKASDHSHKAHSIIKWAKEYIDTGNFVESLRKVFKKLRKVFKKY